MPPKTRAMTVRRVPCPPETPLANLTAASTSPIIPSTDNITPNMRFSIDPFIYAAAN